MKRKFGLGMIGLFGAVAAAVMLFLLIAFVLSSCSVNTSHTLPAADAVHVEIFVTSNGVHTDFVLPVKTPLLDWREQLPLHHFGAVDSGYTHVAFGWGDRRFYMETPTWSDLTPGVALSASLWPTPSAIHVTYLPSRPTPSKHKQSLTLTPAQYRDLVRYIEATFQRDNGAYRLIPAAGYGENDAFYEANGKFYLFKNCNNWVNGGLKAAGVQAALWAPLPFAVMRQLREK